MNIRYSYYYEKMPPDYKVSRLTSVDVVMLENLSEDFIEYDTRIQGGGHYPLPRKGKYMILSLESSIMNIGWQTIRRWTQEKEEYYRRNVGKLFNCIVAVDPLNGAAVR